jgi:hypothetical protein
LLDDRVGPVSYESRIADVHEQLAVDAAGDALSARGVPEPRVVFVHLGEVVAPRAPVYDEAHVRRRLPHGEVVVQDDEPGIERTQRTRQVERELLRAHESVGDEALLRRSQAARQLIGENGDPSGRIRKRAGAPVVRRLCRRDFDGPGRGRLT